MRQVFVMPQGFSKLPLGATLIFLVGACSLVGGSGIEASGFLANFSELVENRERAPFALYWESPEYGKAFEEKRYNFLQIEPVSIKYLELGLRSRKNLPRKLRQQLVEEAQEMARYFTERLKWAVLETQTYPLELVDGGPQKRMLLAIEVIELRPSEPSINSAGTALGVFVPGGGLLKALGKGAVTIEGKLSDAQTGEVLIEFRDREVDKLSAFSFKDFQQYAHARESFDDWSKQIAELLATGPGHKVKDSLPVTLELY